VDIEGSKCEFRTEAFLCGRTPAPFKDFAINVQTVKSEVMDAVFDQPLRDVDL